jgi:hypothetical protein
MAHDQILTALDELRVDDDYHEQFVSAACVDSQARMLRALECGYESLALEILKQDKALSSWRGYNKGSSLTVSGNRDIASVGWSDVMEILMSISNKDPSMLRSLLQGKLSSYIQERGDMPRILSLQALGIEDESERKDAFHPVVYAMLHCDRDGEAPTTIEYQNILRHMKGYISLSSLAANDVFANRVNEASCETLPLLPADRNWRYGGDPKWKKEEHPRRYAPNVSSTKAIHEFITEFERRLGLIPNTERNMPIPWRLIYVGWTSKFEARKIQHYKHATGQNVRK